jgi:hypothetical protein
VRSFSPCGAASSGGRQLRWLLVAAALTVSCGADAERRYADLSSATIALEPQGYTLRYLRPPWKQLLDDPLVKGTRTTVQVGGSNLEIVPASATVLEVAKESSVADPEGLSMPKYRLEAVLLRCDEAQLEPSQNCAQALVAKDLAARTAEGDYDLFGASPRQKENDFDQPVYEIMGQVAETRRYRRIAFFETDQRDMAARLFIEGNPNLGEREVTRLVNAFELTTSQGEP